MMMVTMLKVRSPHRHIHRYRGTDTQTHRHIRKGNLLNAPQNLRYLSIEGSVSDGLLDALSVSCPLLEPRNVRISRLAQSESYAVALTRRYAPPTIMRLSLATLTLR